MHRIPGKHVDTLVEPTVAIVTSRLRDLLNELGQSNDVVDQASENILNSQSVTV